MKVLLVKEGICADVNDGFGERLIEQGKAVPFHAKQEAKTESSEDETTMTKRKHPRRK